jgi:hypothetical protein
MGAWRWLARTAALTAVATLVAQPAAALFSGGAGPVSQSLAAGVLDPPTGLAATDGPCQKNKSVSVQLTWTPTASTFASGYEVLRADVLPGSPFVVIGTVAGQGSSAYLDTTVGFSVGYFYAVRSVRNAWTSAQTASVLVVTLARNCK